MTNFKWKSQWHKEMQLKAFHTMEQDTVGISLSVFTGYSQSCFICKETKRYYPCLLFMPSAEWAGTMVFDSVTKESTQKVPDGQIKGQKHPGSVGPFDSICSVMFLKSIESLQKLPISQVSKGWGPTAWKFSWMLTTFWNLFKVIIKKVPGMTSLRGGGVQETF